MVRPSLAGVLLLNFVPAIHALSPGEIISLVDRRVADGWNKAKVRPAPLSDDAEYLRRVTLDLAGRIPTTAEVREFLADPATDKRARLVDRLLASPSYGRHFATFWRRTWTPQLETLRPGSAGSEEFDNWIAQQLMGERPYDRMARSLLTAGAEGLTPTAFLVAGEHKPENLAANTVRAFLGLNLDCAQCHDHPFARWTRNQFWETAAFFTRPTASARLEQPIPETKRTVVAKFLTGGTLELPKSADAATGRVMLADWVVDSGNPYFAKNAVNRVWAHCFGRGLVEPLDDFSGENPPSHPELLDELAKEFVAGGHNVKSLIRALMLSRAYQATSAWPKSESVPEARVFARMPVRGLTGEQLYDSIRLAAGLPPTPDDPRARKTRDEFLSRFHIDRPVDSQRSILQQLVLMNGDIAAEATRPGVSPLLPAIAGSPFLDRSGQIEALFLATLGRRPTPNEAATCGWHLESGDRERRLADLLWMLLNSVEFNTNH